MRKTVERTCILEWSNQLTRDHRCVSDEAPTLHPSVGALG